MPGAEVDPLLFLGQEVGEDGGEPALVEDVGDMAVAGAVAPAATAVGEGHHATSVVGARERRLERDVAGVDGHLAVHEDEPTRCSKSETAAKVKLHLR